MEQTKRQWKQWKYNESAMARPFHTDRGEDSSQAALASAGVLQGRLAQRWRIFFSGIPAELGRADRHRWVSRYRGGSCARSPGAAADSAVIASAAASALDGATITPTLASFSTWPARG